MHDYEILNRLIRTGREVTEGLCAVTEYTYAANRNRTLVRFGQATNGSAPFKIVRTLCDERDLVFREIRAEGYPSQSTAQTDYDGNGKVRATRLGLEDASPRITVNVYDGYDRRTAQTDPMGNVTTRHYDANGNRISERRDGELTMLKRRSLALRPADSPLAPACSPANLDRDADADVADFAQLQTAP